MNAEDFEKIYREETKWLTESQFQELEKESVETLNIQEDVFTPEFNFFLSEVLTSFSKKDIEEAIELIKALNNLIDKKKTGVVITSFTYLLSEILRVYKKRKEMNNEL